MINLYYCESYWNYSTTTTGPQKVIENLIASLHQEKIEYSVNQEKYKHNFLVQYNHVGHEKHSKIETDTCIIGPQVWLFDDYGEFLIDHKISLKINLSYLVIRLQYGQLVYNHLIMFVILNLIA